jgi:Fe-S cluster assembly protein SufB
MEFAPKGLNEDIVRLISEKNGEPEWMTEWRLGPTEALAADERARLGDGRLSDRLPGPVLLRPPKSMEEKPKSLDEVDPKLLAPMRSSASR